MALLYSLFPLLGGRYRHEFFFTDDVEYVLHKDSNDYILLIRYLQSEIAGRESTVEFMSKIRSRYRVVANFEDNAGAECHTLGILPLVDLYYTRSLYRERELYRNRFHGERLYAQFYHDRYGVSDKVPGNYEELFHPEQLHKLRLAWNVGAGHYPRTRVHRALSRRIASRFGISAVRYLYRSPASAFSGRPKDSYCSARFGHHRYSPSVGYQRKLFADTIRGDTRFLTGPVPQSRYTRELRRVRAVLSPFGWGEVCLRDFEAVLSRAALIKPDMGHLTTWPDIYVPHETYVPVSWDGSDLIPVVDRLLSNHEEADRLTGNAEAAYTDALNGLDSRVEKMINEIRSVK